MELEIISMTPQERMYSYSQSSQIEAQTGCIGHLRGDFGAGQEFFSSWFDHRGEYKTDEFKAEFDEVVITNLNKMDKVEAMELVSTLRQSIQSSAELNEGYAQEFADIPLVGRTIFEQQQLLYNALLEWLKHFEGQFLQE